ncbi:MAG: glycosyltransferase family 2 protein [Lacibacter sp.]
MRVCGFSFIRNGIKYDYPFEQSLKSILPLCEKVVVAVGQSDDETLKRVKALDPKIEILETVWDDGQKEGGRVLALETDKAFQAVSAEYDWAFYIQGDEVVHEKYYPAIRKSMEQHLNDKRVEGLLFNYHHFFGSYDYVGSKYSWYRREVRIIRNDKSIFSYRDAQGFRKKPNEKLHVKLIPAAIHHYGWVRNPAAMQQKINANIHIYMREDSTAAYEAMSKSVYDYQTANEPVERYLDTHPAVMEERIRLQNWPFQPDMKKKYASTKDRLKRTIYKLTGWYPGEYRNYKLI